jgi:phosphoribosyl 1,2-cyclic phosphodiesterase
MIVKETATSCFNKLSTPRSDENYRRHGMNEQLDVRFWGVRGSYPVPRRETIQYGGNTACVEIRAGEKTLILDAGTGIIPLGQQLARDIGQGQRTNELVLLFSHLHHDHVQGFPFFTPAYMPNTSLHIFGPGTTPDALETVLEQNQSPTSFPVRLGDMGARKNIRSVRDSQMIIWDESGVQVTEASPNFERDALIVQMRRSVAHPGGVYLYRISWRGKSIVYATDTEGYVGGDRKLVSFAERADLLIHDAQYTEAHYRGELTGVPSTQGYGHSTVKMACATANAAQVGQLVLFHHDPSYDDEQMAEIERDARERFADVQVAYEGLTVSLNVRELARV